MCKPPSLRELCETATMTRPRQRIHAAAAKAGWSLTTNAYDEDTLVKGDYRVEIWYTASGAIQGAMLLGPKKAIGTANETDGIYGETRRFAQIILWLGQAGQE